MNEVMGAAFVLIGIGLIATRNLSAELHEKWNRQFWWTRWATGHKAMRASRICNVVIGLGFLAGGLLWLISN